MRHPRERRHQCATTMWLWMRRFLLEAICQACCPISGCRGGCKKFRSGNFRGRGNLGTLHALLSDTSWKLAVAYWGTTMRQGVFIQIIYLLRSSHAHTYCERSEKT